MKFSYPRQLCFTCRRCGKCCGDTEDRTRTVLLLQVEAFLISQKTRLRISDFAEESKRHDRYIYVMKKQESGKCVFLKDRNICAVYRYRPLVCRFYPFELKESKGSIHVFRFTKECPSVGRGARLRKAHFEKLIESFARTVKKDSLFSSELIND